MNQVASLLFTISMLGEAIVALMVFRRLPRNPHHLKVALLCLVWLLVDCLVRFSGNAGRGAHWSTFLMDPVQATIVLSLLAEWQTTLEARLALRLVMPGYLCAIAILILLFQNSGHFGLLTHTITSLTLLSALSLTMVTRSAAERGTAILRRDWFWVCAALVLFFLLEGIGGPVLRRLYLRADHAAFDLALSIQLAGMLGVLLSLGLGVESAAVPIASEPTALLTPAQPEEIGVSRT